MGFIVAIDGPAGSGKGTVTSIVAKKLKLNSIDTGAMYRCVTLQMIRNNVSLEDMDKVKAILENIDIELLKENGEQVVKLNGENVTKEIRENPVNKLVSNVAAILSIVLIEELFALQVNFKPLTWVTAIGVLSTTKSSFNVIDKTLSTISTSTKNLYVCPVAAATWLVPFLIATSDPASNL